MKKVGHIIISGMLLLIAILLICLNRDGWGWCIFGGIILYIITAPED